MGKNISIDQEMIMDLVTESSFLTPSDARCEIAELLGRGYLRLVQERAKEASTPPSADVSKAEKSLKIFSDSP